MRQLLTTLLLCCFLMTFAAEKREFRGAWIQCVNGQFQGMSTSKMQHTLSQQLDVLQQYGCNAIIFQVRPECDALYQSNIEPWSRFLTGVQGQAPSPYWDPLQWMITECHRRGMELHAWINPYRAKTKVTKELAGNHIAIIHPELVFPYDGQFILNPARKESRDYICRVVEDIVTRYDIDGLHMDDYFYPYPVSGQTIPDDADYQQNSNGIRSKNDWRRDNVNVFIRQVAAVIHKAKPWVKFGISPFGIYRNKKSDPINGSATNGLQNYDDLYADVLLWVNNGWIDYCVPQLYWQIGHSAADYQTLIQWWDRHAAARPLFIGEDVLRTVEYPDLSDPNIHQLEAKMKLHRQCPNVNGTVLWYALAAVENHGNYGTSLRTRYWNTPALQPSMPFLCKKTPGKVRKVKVVNIDGENILFWTAPKAKDWQTEATQYVIYAFHNGERININDPSHIVGITSDTFFKLPYYDGSRKFTYVITALNRIQNEGAVLKKKVRV